MEVGWLAGLGGGEDGGAVGGVVGGWGGGFAGGGVAFCGEEVAVPGWEAVVAFVEEAAVVAESLCGWSMKRSCICWGGYLREDHEGRHARPR